MRLLLVLLPFSLLAVGTGGAVHHHHKNSTPLPLFIGNRPTVGFNGQRLGAAGDNGVAEYAAVTSKTVSLKRDHFNDSDSATYNHRYFVNSQYANNSQLHFLYVEGEAVANPAKIGDDTLPLVSMAKTFGAKLWLLEHRFYGQSRPFKRMLNVNYRVLNSQQAVEDIADFIKAQNKASGEASPKWVVFGSSYAGALAVWFRQKYPQLTIGAVASSPLVVITMDNYLFELNLKESFLGYSFDCFEGVRMAARAIRNELQFAKGVQRLNSELNLTPPMNESGFDYKSAQYLHTSLMPIFQIPVLYNRVNVGPFGAAAGIPEICEIMANESVPHIDKVYKWSNVLFTALYGAQDANGNWSIPNNYGDFLIAMRNPRYDENNLDWSTARNWFYQSCYEFGTWATTDNGRNIFGTEVPNSYYMALCSDVFGGTIHIDNYDIVNHQAAIKQTQATWDCTSTYKGSNTVITNGGNDPWRHMTVNATSDSSSTVLLMDNVGHSADFQPPGIDDSADVAHARLIIQRAVRSWIKGASSGGKLEGVEADYQPKAVLEPPVAVEATQRFSEPKPWLGRVVSEHPDKAFISAIRRQNERSQHHAGRAGRRYSHPLLMQRTRTMQRMKERAKAQSTDLLNSNLSSIHAVSTGYMEQPVDHFDPTNTLTYFQRFMGNDRWVEERNPPIFLMINGESSIYWTEITEGFMQYIQWAMDFKAMVYSLEHRYYGESQPFANTSVAALRYLTTEQALADIASFIRTINAQNNYTNPRWIVFGGSYSGSLAAAFRVRYPDLSLGAIASSAPIQAVTDFWAYMRDVETAADTYGDSECGEGVRKMFYEMHRKMNTKAERYTMKSEFCMRNDWHEQNYVDEKDVEQMFADYIFLLDTIVQYDDEDHYRLKYFCGLYESCGAQLAQNGAFGDCEYIGLDACQYVAELMIIYVGAEVKQSVRDEVDAIIVGVMANETNKARAQQLIGERVTPIFKRMRHHKSADVSGQLASSNATIHKAYDYNDSGDNETDEYQDPDSESSDDSDPCDEGSNWDGSSGPCNEGDNYFEYTCDYCCYCSFYSYDRHVVYTEDIMSRWYGEARTWIYQTCTEWGYMLSTNYGRNIFEDSLPVNYLIDFCTDVFGPDFNRSRTDGGVRNTNYLYGGQDHYNGTNVIFINGSEDPWHMLSVVPEEGHTPLQSSVQTILMKDMYKWRHGDKAVLVEMRKKVKKQLRKWIHKSKKSNKANKQ